MHRRENKATRQETAHRMKPDREGREKNKIKRKMASALQRKKKKKKGEPLRVVRDRIKATVEG